MSENPSTSKIIDPYADALFECAVQIQVIDKILGDALIINGINRKTEIFFEYLNNPGISKNAKKEFLKKIIKSDIHPLTFKFLMLLIDRDRTSILDSVFQKVVDLVRESSGVKNVTVETAFPFTESQESDLTEKLKKLSKASRIYLSVRVNSDLIGGFLIRTDSQLIDFSVKNKLEKLAKHLDAVLEI